MKVLAAIALPIMIALAPVAHADGQDFLHEVDVIGVQTDTEEEQDSVMIVGLASCVQLFQGSTRAAVEQSYMDELNFSAKIAKDFLSSAIENLCPKVNGWKGV